MITKITQKSLNTKKLYFVHDGECKTFRIKFWLESSDFSHWQQTRSLVCLDMTAQFIHLEKMSNTPTKRSVNFLSVKMVLHEESS